MPLSSLFQRFRQMAAPGRSVPGPDAMSVSPSDVEAARVRARRRLIGMVVLVGAGVVGFPWLFETQPRPLSQDVEIVRSGVAGEDALTVARGTSARGVTGRVNVAGIVPPAQEHPASVNVRPEAQEAGSTAPGPGAVRDGARDSARETGDAGRESISSKPPAASADRKAADKPDKASDKVAEKVANKVTDKAADKTAAAKPAARDAGKDKPADVRPTPTKPSDNKAADKAANNRYVVQFGAFADAKAAQAARVKVEKLGIKTYAQQVDTPQGKRIRVRIGPYADKAEADKALATLRKAGLSAAVLTL